MSSGAITAVHAPTTAVASSAVSRVTRKRRRSRSNQKNSASAQSVASMIQLVRWWVIASAARQTCTLRSGAHGHSWGLSKTRVRR
jgi:hypothetical protein